MKVAQGPPRLLFRLAHLGQLMHSGSIPRIKLDGAAIFFPGPAPIAKRFEQVTKLEMGVGFIGEPECGAICGLRADILPGILEHIAELDPDVGALRVKMSSFPIIFGSIRPLASIAQTVCFADEVLKLG